MPATSADIVLATRAAVFDTRSDSAVQTRHPGARDTGDTPRPAFWDLVTDAAVINSAAFALIGTERRRLAVRTQGITDFTGAMDYTLTTPTVTVTDTESAVSGLMLASRIECDWETETTAFEVFG